MFCVFFFIIFVYRCLILYVTCYICVCLCLYFLFFPVRGSCLVIFVFLSKPPKQQEAVNNVTNVKFCFCLQTLEYLFFYQSQESNRRWSNRSAAVTDRLRLQPFWGLNTSEPTAKPILLNICNICLTCDICDFCNIFDIFIIFNISDNCKICDVQILNHLKQSSGLRQTQHICIPVIALYETVVA